MSKTSNLLNLANTIQAQVAEIQKYLAETRQPDPSFDGQVQPTDWHGVDDTRSAVLQNLVELQDLLSTPAELLQTVTPTDLVSRHALDRFNIYSAVPINGTIAYEELAKKTHLPATTLRRLVRHAITQRIFHEPSPDIVAHTQASRLLAENSKVRDYHGTVCQEVWPAATRVCDALERWPNPTGRNETGYQLAFGRTLYDTLAADPKKQARYDNAMGAHANTRSYSLQHVIDNVGFAAFETGTVVDVGGGVGTASKALAKAFPQLSFVVQDRAEVLIEATMDDEEPTVQKRITFMEHDFFTPQPVKDAEVYFFRRVVMEWPDDKVVEIMAALEPALKQGALVQIQDPYIPDPGSCPIWQERRFRNSDILAFALSGGNGQREPGAWKEIFEKAGPGFEFKGIRTVPASDISFIEAVWRGE